MTGRRLFGRIAMVAMVAFSFGLLLAAPARATGEERVAVAALAPGSWSVQFSVDPNLLSFQLGSYSGSTLSLKRHLASGNALRFGLSVGVNTGTDKSASVEGDTSFTRDASTTRDLSKWSIGMSAYYLWYSRGAAPIHAYWGAGPTVSWSRGHDNQTAANLNTQGGYTGAVTNSAESQDRIWQVGAAGALGAEWLITSRFGLFAEYASRLTYSSSKTTNRATSISPIAAPLTRNSELRSHGWSFSGSGGRLGISAYF